MKQMIKTLPLPICGLMLGITALGNLMRPYSETIRWVLGFIALLIFILVLLKIIFYHNIVVEELKNPVLKCTQLVGPAN